MRASGRLPQERAALKRSDAARCGGSDDGVRFVLGLLSASLVRHAHENGARIAPAPSCRSLWLSVS